MKQESVNTFSAIKFPRFVQLWIIADLVFCSFRMILFILGVWFIKLAIHPLTVGPLFYVFVLDVFLNLMIALFGGIADIGLLCKNISASKNAYTGILFTVCSMFVSVWELYLIVSEDAPLAPETYINIIIGFLLIVSIRCVLLIFYWKAISGAKDSFLKRANV